MKEREEKTQTAGMPIKRDLKLLVITHIQIKQCHIVRQCEASKIRELGNAKCWCDGGESLSMAGRGEDWTALSENTQMCTSRPPFLAR